MKENRLYDFFRRSQKPAVLSKNHPLLPKIHSSIERRKAGYRGELNMDYHLTFLPPKRYSIVRDLHLTDQFPFQIDTVLLSSQLIVILEKLKTSMVSFFSIKIPTRMNLKGR